jgi:hypothetical protein
MDSATPPPRRYVSYLLRLWETQTPTGVVWRASLEAVGTGERHMFQTVQALTDFLEHQTVPLGSTNSDES